MSTALPGSTLALSRCDSCQQTWWHTPLTRNWCSRCGNEMRQIRPGSNYWTWRRGTWVARPKPYDRGPWLRLGQ